MRVVRAPLCALLGGNSFLENDMTSKVVHPTAPGAGPAAVPTRRGLLLGAGVAGAAALAVKALPGTAATEVVAQAAVKPILDPAGGYQLTPHVLRYYETTKV